MPLIKIDISRNAINSKQLLISIVPRSMVFTVDYSVHSQPNIYMTNTVNYVKNITSTINNFSLNLNQPVNFKHSNLITVVESMYHYIYSLLLNRVINRVPKDSTMISACNFISYISDIQLNLLYLPDTNFYVSSYAQIKVNYSGLPSHQTVSLESSVLNTYTVMEPHPVKIAEPNDLVTQYIRQYEHNSIRIFDIFTLYTSPGLYTHTLYTVHHDIAALYKVPNIFHHIEQNKYCHNIVSTLFTCKVYGKPLVLYHSTVGVATRDLNTYELKVCLTFPDITDMHYSNDLSRHIKLLNRSYYDLETYVTLIDKDEQFESSFNCTDNSIEYLICPRKPGKIKVLRCTNEYAIIKSASMCNFSFSLSPYNLPEPNTNSYKVATILYLIKFNSSIAKTIRNDYLLTYQILYRCEDKRIHESIQSILIVISHYISVTSANEVNSLYKYCISLHHNSHTTNTKLKHPCIHPSLLENKEFDTEVVLLLYFLLFKLYKNNSNSFTFNPKFSLFAEYIAKRVSNDGIIFEYINTQMPIERDMVDSLFDPLPVDFSVKRHMNPAALVVPGTINQCIKTSCNGQTKGTR